jgi:hypothetical protein
MNTDNNSETTKKKPRNRKLQRYARKLRKQGENESNIQNYKRANKQQAHEQIHDEGIHEIIPLNGAMETTNDSMSPRVCALFLCVQSAAFPYCFLGIARSICSTSTRKQT